MRERTRCMYPLRRLVELKGGSIPEAAKEVACSADLLQEAFRSGEVAMVVVLAAECIVRRHGPSEVQRTILTVDLPADRRGEFGILTKPFDARVVHFCETCLVVSSPWRNVGSVQEVARHLGGEALRAEEAP